jgi:hypothetical protein
MTQAARIAHGDLAPEARAQALLAVLADEAFATHFLEDAFAAGHVAGNWGDQAVRLGTHDYYNEYGIEAVTWKGKHYIALGDGNMGPEDEQRAAAAVRDSLVQVLEALDGKTPEGITPLGDDIDQAHFMLVFGGGGSAMFCAMSTHPPPVALYRFTSAL